MTEGHERRHLMRRASDHFTEADKEELATMAAKKALDMVAMQIGRNVIRWVFWVVGAAALAIWLWLEKFHKAP